MKEEDPVNILRGSKAASGAKEVLLGLRLPADGETADRRPKPTGIKGRQLFSPGFRHFCCQVAMAVDYSTDMAA